MLDFIKSLLRWVESFLTALVRFASKHPFDTAKYRFNFPEVWYSPWRSDPAFQSIYRRISANTLISERKLFDLLSLAKQVRGFSATRVLEIGTYQGGSGALLAQALPDAQLTLWDNWGKPVAGDDYFVKKVYAEDSDLSRAQALVKSIGTPSALACEYVCELFPNEQVLAAHPGEYSLVHFDIYDESAFANGIALVWPKLCTGGMFICGGYGAISLDKLTEAINRFIEANACTFVQTQSGMGVLIKR